MPYPREQASKGGHSDFIRNPDVKQFLESCSYLREPSDSEAQAIAGLYQPAPIGEPKMLPLAVVASDASKSDAPINNKLPSTQVGFLKVSHVMIKMGEYDGLREPLGHIVNPYKVAEIHRAASPASGWKTQQDVRAAVVSGIPRWNKGQMQCRREAILRPGGRTRA